MKFIARLLSRAVRSSLEEITKLLSHAAVMLYKGTLHTGVKDRHIKFILSAGTGFIDDFNAQVKEAILQQRQDCQGPQIKDLKLVIPKYRTFMDNKIEMSDDKSGRDEHESVTNS